MRGTLITEDRQRISSLLVMFFLKLGGEYPDFHYIILYTSLNTPKFSSTLYKKGNKSHAEREIQNFQIQQNN